jgi:hypothetical protein
LVIYAHHHDLSGGMEPLASVAAAVNRLGDVRWSSIGDIARTNAELLIGADHAVARPYSRRVRIALRPDVRTLELERPEDLLDNGSLVGWSLPGGPTVPFGERTPVPADEPLHVRLCGDADVDPWRVAAPSWRARPKLRRLAVEARDRAWPLAAAAGLVSAGCYRQGIAARLSSL